MYMCEVVFLPIGGYAPTRLCGLITSLRHSYYASVLGPNVVAIYIGSYEGVILEAPPVQILTLHLLQTLKHTCSYWGICREDECAESQ